MGLLLCPFFPLLPKRRIPLFGKWFDGAHHPELVEGEGLAEILADLNYTIFSKFFS